MNIYCKNRSVRHHSAGRFLVTLAALALLATGCRRSEPVQLYGEAQGTYYSVQYFDPQQRNLQPQIDSLLDAFDQSVSLWVDRSLLRCLNAGLTDSLDDILLPLMTNSLAVEDYTDGAFNCRVGRLVQAWGFSFRQRQEPDSAELSLLLQSAHTHFDINNRRLVNKDPATEFDFNAIAQGYAADLVAQMLDRYGIESYLVDIGGEVIARGRKADGNPWRVGIERPAKDSLSAPIVETTIPLVDRSVVTSGSYRKYYEKDGVKYSHTIDPATGRPVTHSLLSVSVVEKECWLADAMATAYMVMGLEKAKAFIADHPQGFGTDAVFFIYDSCGTMASYATPGFEKMILQEK